MFDRLLGNVSDAVDFTETSDMRLSTVNELGRLALATASPRSLVLEFVGIRAAR